jgi:hypothetical protein
VTNKAEKEVKVKLAIKTGPVSDFQKACWKKWWAARISEAKSECQK